MWKEFEWKDHPTNMEKRDKEEKIEETEKILTKLYKLQRVLYAQKKYAILVIFQWLDASWKDGVCRSIFGKLDPMGIDIVSFREPSEEEAWHDYLRRLHKKIPSKGMIQIFNRSYFEDILVPTVLKTHDKDEIQKRFKQINNFEDYLEENNIKIFKFYFNVSPKIQKERMIERLENPEKFWKHGDGDRKTIELRDQYEKVYEKIFEKCNNPKWNFVPADHNWQKNYFVAKVLFDEMKSLDLKWPNISTDRSLDQYLENVEGIDDIKEFKDFREKIESEVEKNDTEKDKKNKKKK